MADIDIKRGYEVLPDNNVRFGIRVINNSSSAISDVEVLLDYSEDSFNLQGNKIQKLGTIPPSVPRTAKFVLQPKGCIHKEEVGATVLYKDHAWIKHVEQMCPKEVHCVCPFLKEKSISRAEFLAFSNSGYSAESGVNFENINSGRVVELLSNTCKNRLYKVDEFPVDGGSILYLAGDAVGEKAYYLLTAVVKEYEGLTQVFLRANSDKDHGLTGFLNETLDNLRHLVVAGKVREIGVIKHEQVINIIDSIVQRSSFGGSGGKGSVSVNIQDSVVQRTEFNVSEDGGVEEERLRKEKEQKEREALAEKDRQEELRKEQTPIAKKKGKSRTNIFMLIIVLGALFVGFVVFAPGSDDVRDAQVSVRDAQVSVRDAQVSTPQPEVIIDTATPTSEVTPSNIAKNVEPEVYKTPAMDPMTDSQSSSIAYNACDIEANPYTYSTAEISGKVVDVINSGGYTYIQLDDGTGKIWAAIPQTNVNQGTEVTVLGSIMKDFTSSALGMTFAALIFSDGIQTAAIDAPTNAEILETPASYFDVVISGVVNQTMDAPGYTYIEIDDGTGLIWAAVTQTDLTVGDNVTVAGGTQVGFESTTLNKTFDVLVMGAIVTDDGTTTSAPVSPHGF